MITKCLLVTSQLNHTVREYNATTGAFVKMASGGALGDPLGIVIGLDGNLLVSDGQTNQVKRYDSTSGAFIDVFASTNLSGPAGMTIHQGMLYVTNSNPPQGVQRFDAATGVNTGSFVPSFVNPSPRDVKVNPANNRLYVLYYNAATVETFDLTTMESFGLLMPAGNPIGSGGLYTPSAMAFGPDGNLYISGGTFGGNLGVRRYNPTTGEFIDLFANTGSDLYVPIGITFGPDNNLYVAAQNAANVMRFNYPTGAFMDFFIPDGGGGLTAPFHLTFGAGQSPSVFPPEFYLSIDPMALILPSDLYPIWAEMQHPHEPRVAEIEQVMRHMTMDQRKKAVGRAKLLAEYCEAVEQSAAKMK